MVVVFSSDESYFQHLLVALRSLYFFNNKHNLHVFILDGGIADQSKGILVKYSSEHKFYLEFIKVNFSLYSKFIVHGHLSLAAYYRISIPDLLPINYDKALYLDCDVIINGKIESLWLQDLDTYALAAVPEFDNIRNKEMGLGDTKTFNSGVLLFNLEKWRKEGVSGKVLKFISDNPDKIKFQDQDALNAVLLNDWLELPIKWNLTSPYVSKRKSIIDNNITEQIDNPSIIHFNESFKPWHYQLRHPFKYLYYKFLSETEFKDYVAPDKTFINIIKKTASLILIFFHLKQ